MNCAQEGQCIPQDGRCSGKHGRFRFHDAQLSSVVRRISIISFVFLLVSTSLAGWFLSRRAPSALMGQADEFTRNALHNQWIAITRMRCYCTLGGEVNLNQYPG